MIYKKNVDDNSSALKQYSVKKYGSYNNALEVAIQFRGDYIEKLKQHIDANAEFIKTHGYPANKKLK
ncbi:hypothetical protein [Shewanella surugensis]|uniref:Uncharacterized protein n=1 Tax=Shewanella surugensis TaxID=212020 RepID=A0ABT0L5M6_9GAMM|nr:hypothetical protein [Shewanella surugensis]MCL1122981.1 hypothetical protein [Shewanella surugensis]